MRMKLVFGLALVAATAADASKCSGTHSGALFVDATTFAKSLPPCIVDGALYPSSIHDGELVIPGIKKVTDVFSIHGTRYSKVSAPDLEEIGRELFISENKKLYYLQFPKLKSVEGIFVKDNPQFTSDLSRSFKSLEYIGKIKNLGKSLLFFDNGSLGPHIGRFDSLSKISHPVSLSGMGHVSTKKVAPSCAAPTPYDRYRRDLRYNRKGLTKCTKDSRSASGFTEKQSGEVETLAPDQMELEEVPTLTDESVEKYENSLNTARTKAEETSPSQTSPALSSFSSSSRLVLAGSALAILANMFMMTA